jgi:hypothetical protein
MAENQGGECESRGMSHGVSILAAALSFSAVLPSTVSAMPEEPREAQSINALMENMRVRALTQAYTQAYVGRPAANFANNLERDIPQLRQLWRQEPARKARFVATVTAATRAAYDRFLVVAMPRVMGDFKADLAKRFTAGELAELSKYSTSATAYNEYNAYARQQVGDLWKSADRPVSAADIDRAGRFGNSPVGRKYRNEYPAIVDGIKRSAAAVAIVHQKQLLGEVHRTSDPALKQELLAADAK